MAIDLWNRLIAATETICSKTYTGNVGINTIHDDLLGHYGRTRETAPTTIGDYLRGISVIASYHKSGSFNPDSPKLSFQTIVEYLEFTCTHSSKTVLEYRPDGETSMHQVISKCDECGQEFTESEEHTYSDALDYISISDADHKVFYECNNCHATLSNLEVHTFSDTPGYNYMDSTEHERYYICTQCNGQGSIAYFNHTWNSDGYCSECGGEASGAPVSFDCHCGRTGLEYWYYGFEVYQTITCDECGCTYSSNGYTVSEPDKSNCSKPDSGGGDNGGGWEDDYSFYCEYCDRTVDKSESYKHNENTPDIVFGWREECYNCREVKPCGYYHHIETYDDVWYCSDCGY